MTLYDELIQEINELYPKAIYRDESDLMCQRIHVIYNETLFSIFWVRPDNGTAECAAWYLPDNGQFIQLDGKDTRGHCDLETILCYMIDVFE